MLTRPTFKLQKPFWTRSPTEVSYKEIFKVQIYIFESIETTSSICDRNKPNLSKEKNSPAEETSDSESDSELDEELEKLGLTISNSIIFIIIIFLQMSFSMICNLK